MQVTNNFISPEDLQKLALRLRSGTEKSGKLFISALEIPASLHNEWKEYFGTLRCTVGIFEYEKFLTDLFSIDGAD